MERLLIVDGSNLLFQMFFGMPARITNQQGKGIWGTLGFVGALLKIIRRVEPTHVVVLFDGEHENERCSYDEAYKANRPDYRQVPEEESPFSQLEDIYQALDFLGIKHRETTDCETDDWVAAYAYTYGQQIEIIISSFDSDFFQLITSKVSVLRYRGDNTVIWTPKHVEEKYGITPEQYAGYKALVGDTADNIKGVPKVGPKTAAELMKQFGSLAELLENAECIAKPTVRASVMEHRERLLLNDKLIKLENKKEVPLALEELEYTYCGMTTTEVLKGIGIY